MIAVCFECGGGGLIGPSWDSRVCRHCDGAGVVELLEGAYRASLSKEYPRRVNPRRE